MTCEGRRAPGTALWTGPWGRLLEGLTSLPHWQGHTGTASPSQPQRPGLKPERRDHRLAWPPASVSTGEEKPLKAQEREGRSRAGVLGEASMGSRVPKVKGRPGGSKTS